MFTGKDVLYLAEPIMGTGRGVYTQKVKRGVVLHGKEAGSANHPHTNLIGQPSTFTLHVSKMQRKGKENKEWKRQSDTILNSPFYLYAMLSSQSVILKLGKISAFLN